MLRSGNDLKGLKIRANNGEIGKVDQFLFDDASWTIRYMVVNTAGWLLKELVLIAPQSIAGVDWDDQRVDVNLTREQVEQAPPIATDQPVSRQMETELATYYGYHPYWYGPGLWGGTGYPFGAGVAAGYPAAAALAEDELRQPESDELPEGDQHLRSTREVGGYSVHAQDGDIGHVKDFLMDDETWTIRYLVLDTGGWWSGKEVVVAPRWASKISWEERLVYVDLTREQVKSSPEYSPNQLSRDEEQRLHQHLRRPGYWEER